MAEKKSDEMRLREAQQWIKDVFVAASEKEIGGRLGEDKVCSKYGFESHPIHHPSGVMRYEYKGTMHTYEIRPGVTPESFIVETLFDGQRMTMESAKDIREWTKEKIIADFWAGHEKWAKRERTATEIRAGRMRVAEMIRRRNIHRS